MAYLAQASPDSFPPEADVMAVIEAAVASIAANGGVGIERLDPLLPVGSKAASGVTVFTKARRDIMADFPPERFALLDVLPRELTERAAAVGDAEFEQAQRRAHEIWDGFTLARPLDGFDIVLTPSVRIRPFQADQRYPDGYDPYLVPHGLDDGTATVIELGIFNMLGGWSCFNLPCGFTGDGLPVGLQVAVRPSANAVALSMQVTAHLQRMLGLQPAMMPF
jgi:Asp-tRNA(Asn)/Glu-tRNA(Gln) amidotransferase A subunit family amidase